MPNDLAAAYLRAQQETTEDWDGCCGSFADELLREADRGDLLYIEGDIPWTYHMAALIDGFVHDPWCEAGPVPLFDWLVITSGGGHVDLTINGEDVYSGSSTRFCLPCSPTFTDTRNLFALCSPKPHVPRSC